MFDSLRRTRVGSLLFRLNAFRLFALAGLVGTGIIAGASLIASQRAGEAEAMAEVETLTQVVATTVVEPRLSAALLDPRAARVLIDTRNNTTTIDLTDREQEVLLLVRAGRTNKAIARELHISEKTVKAHLTRVYTTLGVSDRTQAALWAKEHLDAL